MLLGVVLEVCCTLLGAGQADTGLVDFLFLQRELWVLFFSRGIEAVAHGAKKGCFFWTCFEDWPAGMCFRRRHAGISFSHFVSLGCQRICVSDPIVSGKVIHQYSKGATSEIHENQPRIPRTRSSWIFSTTRRVHINTQLHLCICVSHSGKMPFEMAIQEIGQYGVQAQCSLFACLWLLHQSAHLQSLSGSHRISFSGGVDQEWRGTRPWGNQPKRREQPGKRPR